MKKSLKSIKGSNTSGVSLSDKLIGVLSDLGNTFTNKIQDAVAGASDYLSSDSNTRTVRSSKSKNAPARNGKAKTVEKALYTTITEGQNQKLKSGEGVANVFAKIYNLMLLERTEKIKRLELEKDFEKEKAAKQERRDRELFGLLHMLTGTPKNGAPKAKKENKSNDSLIVKILKGTLGGVKFLFGSILKTTWFLVKTVASITSSIFGSMVKLISGAITTVVPILFSGVKILIKSIVGAAIDGLTAFLMEKGIGLVVKRFLGPFAAVLAGTEAWKEFEKFEEKEVSPFAYGPEYAQYVAKTSAAQKEMMDYRELTKNQRFMRSRDGAVNFEARGRERILAKDKELEDKVYAADAAAKEYAKNYQSKELKDKLEAQGYTVETREQTTHEKNLGQPAMPVIKKDGKQLSDVDIKLLVAKGLISREVGEKIDSAKMNVVDWAKSNVATPVEDYLTNLAKPIRNEYDKISNMEVGGEAKKFISEGLGQLSEMMNIPGLEKTLVKAKEAGYDILEPIVVKASDVVPTKQKPKVVKSLTSTGVRNDESTFLRIQRMNYRPV